MGAKKEWYEQKKRVEIAAKMMEGYPGEFEPHEHEFIADCQKLIEEGSNHFIMSAALWSRVERLWSHEQGMLS